MTNLETFFADTVAAGWAPRNPCTDAAELAKLEQSGVRGDCISPLLIEGDTIFIDRSAKPEPGDVVAFALSQRGADAQNSALPPGQSPWKAGDRWCKLYGTRHGFALLYDRHGSEMTATLASCEDPHDVPLLFPVRNILRNGRLLFGPAAPASPMIPRRGVLLGALGGLALSACTGGGIKLPEPPASTEGATSSTQIGSNAVSQTVSAIDTATHNYSIPTTGSNYDVDVLTASITTQGGTVGIDVTANISTTVSSAQLLLACRVGVSRGGTFLTNAWVDLGQISTPGTPRQPITVTITDLPAPGSYTYGVHIQAGASGSGTPTVTANPNSTIKLREYKK
jgi:hypothetical protein